MPIKFANSLTAKLNRRSKAGKAYWEEEVVKGLPFLIAIADFHRPAAADQLASMTDSASAITRYLYGFEQRWEKVDGQLVMESVPIESHTYGTKTIPSGFFSLAGAENVSAVIFTNAGTIAKFDRIGVLAGYGPPKHKYVRIGFRYDPDPNAAEGTRFAEEVGKDGYSEGWADEIQVFHNPNAVCPLPPDWFGGLQQVFFEDGQIQIHYGHEAVLSSFTLILAEADQ